MPIYKTKNGDVIEIPDDVPAARRSQLMREYGVSAPVGAAPATRTEARQAGVPRKGMLGRYTDAVGDTLKRDASYLRRIQNGLLLGQRPRIEAGVDAAIDTLSGKGGFRENYDRAILPARRREAKLRRDTEGFAGEAAEFAGGMLVPTGSGNLAVKGVNKVLEGAGKSQLGRVGQYLTRGGAQGGTIGGITAALNSQDLTNVKDVAERFAGGAGWGTAIGAGLGFAAPVASSALTYGRRLAQGQKGRIERALEGRAAAEEQVIEAVKRGGSISAAESRIAAMNQQGAEPILADASRTTRDAMRTLTDRGAKGAQELEDALVSRADRRGGRLRNVIEDISGINSGATTAETLRTTQQARKAVGEGQYAPGGPLDKPFLLTPQQNKALTARVAPGNPADRTFRQFYKEAVETINANPNFRAPKAGEPATARVIDETLRLYRQRINQLYKAGEGNQAAALRAQFDALREGLRKQNPDYASILDYQARGLAKERAIVEAEKIAGGIFTKPRETMDAIRQISHPDDVNAVRGVLADRLFRETGNRAAYRKLRGALNDPNQPEAREVVDFIMGGQGGTKRLEDWLSAERQGVLTEQRLGNSATSRNLAAAEQFESDRLIALGNAGRAGAGVVTGSPGMVANALLNTTRYGAAAARGANQAVVDPAMLALMRRTAKPGDLTRMEQKALREAQRRAKRRAAPANLVGSGAGVGVANMMYPGSPAVFDEEQ
jgi:hypothetical protein